MINEKDAQNLLAKSEISLQIDTYDDIFSDFDPRPYSQRALSDDFLIESKKASHDKKDTIELRFLIPRFQRKLEQEIIIKRRLREHFKKHVQEINQEYSNIIKQGLIFVFIGVIFMILTTFILIRNMGTSAILTFLSVLAEPAGWFLFWEGLNLTIFKSKVVKPDLEFYRKMSKTEIIFESY